MERKMVKKVTSFAGFFLFLAIGNLLSQEVIFERTIPPGWVFKKFYEDRSGSGLKALFLVQDLPDEIRATGRVARRLQVFDSRNDLVADLTLPEWHWFNGFAGNDRLLVGVGDENGYSHIKVFDFNGREIFSFEAGGRWVQKSLLGNEVALTPRLGEERGPISIIDLDKGIEKLRIEPYPEGPRGTVLPGSFLLLGDGYFITALGATIFLENYSRPGNKLWIIQNIGGNVHDARILNRDLIAVGYEAKVDFKKKEFIAGLAVIRWETGEILFNRTARLENGKKDFWYPVLKYFNLLVEEDGSLLFYGDKEALRLPKEKPEEWKWSEKRALKLKADPAQKAVRAEAVRTVKVEADDRYVIVIADSSIRVERRRWVIE